MPQPNEEPDVPVPGQARWSLSTVPGKDGCDRVPEVSDEHLMMRVQSGCSQSLQQLIQRYAQSLLTFLTRLLGNRDDADDLLQEALVSLWSRRGTYCYPKPFRPWVFTIAANKGRELLRNRSRRRFQTPGAEFMNEATHPVAGDRSPLEQVVQQEADRRVLDATQRLPHQQRAVLSLRIWNGLSYAEIAQVLETTESNVRSHMFHALKNLRLSLAGGGNDD